MWSGLSNHTVKAESVRPVPEHPPEGGDLPFEHTSRRPVRIGRLPRAAAWAGFRATVDDDDDDDDDDEEEKADADADAAANAGGGVKGAPEGIG